MAIPEQDRTILRRLAERQASIAALPVQQAKAEMWARLNRLERVKPMVWINEICWPEMGAEPACQCADPFCRAVEETFRRTLYQWDHLRVDMVVDAKFYCPITVRGWGFGVETREKTIPQGDAGSVSSHRYEPVIRDEKDVEKIRMSRIEPDWPETEERYEKLTRLFGDILPIEKTTRSTWWFAPWDLLVQWYGVTEALTDLALRPELIHRAMDRLVSVYLGMIEQYERLGLLSLNNDNIRIGSGGLGYTDRLPQAGFNPKQVRIKDLWGCATAQIFSEVSPEMHWEFALQYEMRWLEKFGLNYYGCCEPLHHKIPMLKRIPNLRKVSMSPKADMDKGVAALGTEYVYSMKPNPAILATDRWDPAAVRAELRAALEKTRGCRVEVILKDISTVRHQPQRLWEWAHIAVEETERMA